MSAQQELQELDADTRIVDEDFDALPESITITKADGTEVTITGAASVKVVKEEIDARRIKQVEDPVEPHVFDESELPFLTQSDLDKAAAAAASSYQAIAQTNEVVAIHESDERAKLAKQAADHAASEVDAASDKAKPSAKQPAKKAAAKPAASKE